MEGFDRTIDYYFTETGQSPYRDWFYSLKSDEDRNIIRARLARVRKGNFGDCAPVGGGVLELRIHEGPGFRVYFGKVGNSVVLLLLGGTKKRQSRDIYSARVYWMDYRRRFK